MVKLKQGHILMIIGAVLLLAMFQATSSGRSDSVTMASEDDFDVSIADFKSAGPTEGDDYWVRLRVDNTEDSTGVMYVQCSILDRAVESWIYDAPISGRTYTVVPTGNCVAHEPYTDTVRLTLTPYEHTTIRFNFVTPNEGDDDVIYCAAFERCYSEGTDSLVSDTAVKAINIQQSSTTDECDVDADCDDDERCYGGDCIFDECDASSDCASDEVCRNSVCETECDANSDCASNEECVAGSCAVESSAPDSEIPARERCNRDKDCGGWLFGGVTCVDNYCVDKDVVEMPDTSDNAITAWAKEHKTVIFFTGLILMIIGAIAVYYKPKGVPQYD